MIGQKTVMFPNLLAEMARHGETKKTVAELLNLSLPSVCRRFDGTVEWSKPEIDMLCMHYEKPYDYLFGT